MADKLQADILQDLVITMAKAMVDYPAEVQVTALKGEQVTVLELQVNNSDLGKVIGKQGRNAKALRTVLSAAATKDGRRVVLEILE